MPPPFYARNQLKAHVVLVDLGANMSTATIDGVLCVYNYAYIWNYATYIHLIILSNIIVDYVHYYQYADSCLYTII